MKITRTAAVAMFVALGFKVADKWDNARINKRLSQMADNVDEDAIKTIESDAVKADVKSVLKALKADETVEVEEEAKAPKAEKAEKPAAKEDEASKGKKDAGKVAEDKVKESAGGKKEEPAAKDEKPAKAAKADKPAKAPKAEAEVDKFGNRVGSQAANINAELAKKWTSVADVAKATKLSEARVRSHFKYLEGRKLGEYDVEKGFRLS